MTDEPLRDAVATHRTERLALRRWRDRDRDPFAALNADPVVMEHFPAPLTRAESDALVDRIEDGFDRHGFGLWAVDVVDDEPGGPRGFIGFVGLSVPAFDAPPVTPCVEVGWRLARAAWGRGYAPEAAAEALRIGFDEHDLHEIVSFTAVVNTPSRRVMEKIGLEHVPGLDFDHPSLPPGHRLERHVLYRIDAPTWRGRRAGAATGLPPEPPADRTDLRRETPT